MAGRSDAFRSFEGIANAELDHPLELRSTAYDHERIAEVPAGQSALEWPIGPHPERSMTRSRVRAERQADNSRVLVNAGFGDRVPRDEHWADARTGIDPFAKEGDKPGLAVRSDEPHADGNENAFHSEDEDSEDLTREVGVRADPNKQERVNKTERHKGHEPDSQTQPLPPKAVERQREDQGGARGAIDLDCSVLGRSVHISTRLVSSTSRAICADSSEGLAKAISSRNRLTNATSTSSPYSSPE